MMRVSLLASELATVRYGFYKAVVAAFFDCFLKNPSLLLVNCVF